MSLKKILNKSCSGFLVENQKPQQISLKPNVVKTHFLLQQLQVPPTIVVHGPSVSTQQVGPSGTVVRRRLDLLTENELATISATIGINYSALNQLHKI